MQGGSAASSGYHSANTAVGKPEYQVVESTIGALANLTTATAADRCVVVTLTEANARLAKQLEDNSNKLWDSKLSSRSRELKEEANKVSIHHQKILFDPWL
jgi:hypothetical protein